MDLAQMPRAAGLVRGARGAARWHPGAAAEALSELFAAGGDGGGTGMGLALLGEALRQREEGGAEEHPVLWVQDAASIRLAGRPYRPGLPAALRDRVLHVAAKTCADALFALEEGLRCRDLAAVVGEIAGNPRALDFTASRRLALAAERHGTLLLLIRHDARADLSAARLRWRAVSAVSALNCWDRTAPGAPRWQGQLFRARAHAPGTWLLGEEKGRLAAWAVDAAYTGAGMGTDMAAAQPAGARLSPAGERASA